MFLMMTRVPPALAAITIALAHLAVLFDIAIRRDLPWWRRITTIAAGVRWAADHGAAVVNLSIDQAGLLAQVQKEGTLNEAAKYAFAKGAFVVGAAGNEHQHLQVYKSGVPVITVAAVDESRHPAAFTNWGGPAEVAAPGVGIWSTAPSYPTTLFPNGTDGTGPAAAHTIPLDEHEGQQ
jgi:subtilisin family serine protease